MTFRETFYQVKGLMESRLHDFGLESADASTMGWTTMLSIEQNTRVTIDVPLILIYSDEFLISGTLETSTYSRLNGKTVKLKVGNTVVATTTTNINGEYSFTHTPVSTGNHSFQVIFEGTNIHAASQSSVVNRTVDKETSVINLDGISTQHYGDTVIFGGQLLDNDGQYISSASVKYYLNNSLVTTLTTDAQGRFSTSKSVDSFDTQNIKFIYDGDSNYTNCEGSSQIDVYQPQLSLTSNKNILSYADNDSATITAQLIDNAPTPQNLAIADTEIIFTYPSTSTAYSDFSSIPVQYDSFELLFKSQGATFYIYGDDEYPLRQIDIPNNNSSKFRLIWDKTKLSLYQDDEVLLNSITNYLDGEAVTSYTDSHVRFATLNNNTVDLTNIKIQNILSNTIDTDANGQAIFTYNSQGIGDITISANIDGSLVTERYDIQDCNYYNTAEVTRSSTNGSTIYDNSLSQALPSKCEISLDVWSNNTSSGEHRFFILPKTQYSSDTTQPSYAIYFDLLKNNQVALGKRENNSSQSVGFQMATATLGTYHTIQFVKDNTDISVYIDDNLIGSFTLSWIDNYTDYCMSMMRWSASGTSKIKNVKFKPL